MSARSLPSLAAVVLLSALAAAGCSEDVTAVVGTDVSFSLYGVLTPQSDTQWVRVYAVAERLEPALDEPIDAAVRSTDLQTGETRTWQDTTMVGTDGMPGHFFFAPFHTAYGHRYRIDVERSDGAAVWAEAAVPAEVELVHLPADEESATVRILFRGQARHFINVFVIYDVAHGPVEQAQARFTARYDRSFVEHAEGRVLQIDLGEAHATMEEQLRRINRWSPAFGLVLHDMTVRLVVADPQWDPPGDAVVFDPLVLVEPGTLSNVTNGFGFVGAGYRLASTWRPVDAALLAAGFNLDDE